MRALLLLAFAFALMGQRDPILVPEVSQHEVQVRQGFTGTELLLFGAVLDPQGRAAGSDYDIVVVLKGPSEPVRLREKERFAARSRPISRSHLPSRSPISSTRKPRRSTSSAPPISSYRPAVSSNPRNRRASRPDWSISRRGKTSTSRISRASRSANRCFTSRVSRCLPMCRRGPIPPRPSPCAMAA